MHGGVVWFPLPCQPLAGCPSHKRYGREHPDFEAELNRDSGLVGLPDGSEDVKRGPPAILRKVEAAASFGHAALV